MYALDIVTLTIEMLHSKLGCIASATVFKKYYTFIRINYLTTSDNTNLK